MRLPTICVAACAATILVAPSALGQTRSVPAAYRQSAQRMYLNRLQVHLQNIRPKAERALQQPMRGTGRMVARSSNNTKLRQENLNRRISRAGYVEPRFYRQSTPRISAYQRQNYERSIRLRSRTVMNTPPPRAPRTYNRSLSAYAR